MRKLALLSIFLALPLLSRAQNTSTFGTINAGASNCTARSCVYYQPALGTPWVVLNVAGTWSGMLQVYAVTSPNATYQNLNSQTWSLLGTIPANGNWSVAVGNAYFILVQASSWSSGAANITMTSSANGSPLSNPVFPGQLTGNGLVAPGGGSSTECWPTNGGPGVLCGGGSSSAALQQQITAPASGQYVVLYPNSGTGAGNSVCSGTGAPAGSGVVAAASPFSGYVIRQNSGTLPICPQFITDTWSGATLPSYITATNVTAVYGGVVASEQCTGNTLNGCGSFNATVNSNTLFTASNSFSTQTFTYLLASGAGAQTFDYAAVGWTGQSNSTVDGSTSNWGGGSATYTPFLIVYYTGSAPPASSVVTVAPPLNFNNGVLSLPLPYDATLDTGSANAYVASVPGISYLIPGIVFKFTPAHSSTATAPTMNLNGLGVVIIEGPQGDVLSSGDISSSHESVLLFDVDGNWRLQNPQVSGAGSISLTTTGTSGAASLTGTVLNIPQYQGALTLTTTGSSGAATLSGSTLNIPQYAGGATGNVPANVIYASEGNGTAAACTLNSNLLTGGGTDVTTCLQAQLDWLGANGGGQLILNGPALISNAAQGTTNSVDGNVQTTCLQTHSNVTIYVPTGGGVFLAASSNCTMLGNNITGNPSATFQTNMKVVGGFWNGNNANQSKYEQGLSANGSNCGFWFGGFNGLEVSGVTLYNVATFNILVSNGENFTLTNNTVTENTTVSGLSTEQDGVHLWGTLSNGVINNFTDNGGDDDPIAFNTDEGVDSFNSGGHWENNRWPNSGGAISNILVNGETLTATNNVVRFIGYSTTNGVATLADISLRNVQGTQTGVGVNNSGVTSCTNILIDNWTVSKSGTVVDPNLGGSSCTVTAGQENITAPSFTVAGASSGTYVKADGTGAGTPSTGLSGMTSGQVPLAASASTVTSSKTLAGSGAGIATGPTTTTNGDCVEFTGTAGQLADAGSACGSGSSFITSLTTTGTSGAATVTSGVLNIPQYSGGTFQPSYLPFPPAATAFTWVNQGSSAYLNNGSMIGLSIPYTSALNWRMLEKSTAYSTPWSVAAYWKATEQAASATAGGLYLYDGTKLLGIELLYTNSSPYVALRVERITNVTTDGATEAAIDMGFYAAAPATNGLAMPIQTTGGLYVRWRDNGTNLFADYSLDGANWVNFYSEAVGAFITPTGYGFGGVQQASGGAQYPTIIDLEGWLETNSATL